MTAIAQERRKTDSDYVNLKSLDTYCVYHDHTVSHKWTYSVKLMKNKEN